MNDVRVSWDDYRYQSKPAYFNDISDRIGGKDRILNSDNIKLFVKLIAEQGTSFCCATYKKPPKISSISDETFKHGLRRENNFEQMQMFALDFDKGITYDEVKERTEKYDLPMLFAYETFSSKNRDRFRTVFLNDASIDDVKVAKVTLQALLTIFPEADPQCKDVTRIFLGGNKKQLLHYDESNPQVTIESIFRNMTLYLKDKHGSTHYKRKIAEISDKTGIALNRNKLLDVSMVEESSTEHTGNPNNADYTGILIDLIKNDAFYLTKKKEKATDRSYDGIITGKHILIRSERLLKIIKEIFPKATLKMIVDDLIRKEAINKGNKKTSKPFNGARFIFINKNKL
jgi:hypothetical protein